VNGCPSRPTRVCLNITGPLSCNFTAAANECKYRRNQDEPDHGQRYVDYLSHLVEVAEDWDA